MDIQKIITRKISHNVHKVFFTATSTLNLDGSWTNSLFIHFKKSDFPLLEYPRINKYGFDCFNCDLAGLPWHGGINFYEETLDGKEVYVKAGCDYICLGYGCFELADHGESILATDVPILLQDFIDLVKYRKLIEDEKLMHKM